MVFDADGVDGSRDDGCIKEGEEEADADAIRRDGQATVDSEG
jgi:hypothetical protein